MHRRSPIATKINNVVDACVIIAVIVALLLGVNFTLTQVERAKEEAKARIEFEKECRGNLGLPKVKWAKAYSLAVQNPNAFVLFTDHVGKEFWISWSKKHPECVLVQEETAQERDGVWKDQWVVVRIESDGSASVKERHFNTDSSVIGCAHLQSMRATGLQEFQFLEARSADQEIWSRAEWFNEYLVVLPGFEIR